MCLTIVNQPASQDLFWPRLRRFIDVIYQYLSIVNPFGSKERISKTQPFISPAAKIYTAPTSKWLVVWEIYNIWVLYRSLNLIYSRIWDPPTSVESLLGDHVSPDFLVMQNGVFPEQTFMSNASQSQLDGVQGFDLVSRQRRTK